VASGKTHDAVTLWTLPLVTGGVWWWAGAAPALVVGGCYLFSGLMFSGDLDIHSNQYRRWGWLRWLWLPYRRWFAHRSMWSHGFLVGTVVRLVYLGSWGVLLGTAMLGLGRILNYPLNLDWNYVWRLVGGYGLWVFGGLELGAMSHSLGDVISSGYKRLVKRFR